MIRFISSVNALCFLSCFLLSSPAVVAADQAPLPRSLLRNKQAFGTLTSDQNQNEKQPTPNRRQHLWRSPLPKDLTQQEGLDEETKSRTGDGDGNGALKTTASVRSPSKTTPTQLTPPSISRNVTHNNASTSLLRVHNNNNNNNKTIMSQERKLWDLMTESDGEDTQDRFGWAVAMNGAGTVVAAGGPENDDGGVGAGHVRVYERLPNETTFHPKGSDIDGDGSFSAFGMSLNMNNAGNRIIIGAPEAGSTDTGKVYVYDYNTTAEEWESSQIFVGVQEEFLGYAVAMSGEGDVVAFSNNPSLSSTANATVYVYSQDGDDGSWVPFGETSDAFIPPVGVFTDSAEGWGSSIALGGNRIPLLFDRTSLVIAIGAPGYNDPDDAIDVNIGFVRSYRFDGRNGPRWLQIEERDILSVDSNADDYYGSSVVLSDDGTTMAIGARDVRNGDQGFVEVFSRSCFNPFCEWGRKGQIINGESNDDRFGSGFDSEAISLSEDGNTVAVGAAGHEGQNGTNSGEVKVYAYNMETMRWELRGTPIDGENPADDSGWSVALSNNGNVVIIGAPRNDGDTEDPSDDRGHFRVWDATPSQAPTTVPSQSPTIQPTFTPITNPIPQFSDLPTPSPVVSPSPSPSEGIGCCVALWNALKSFRDTATAFVQDLF